MFVVPLKAKQDPSSRRGIKGDFSDEEADDLNRSLDVTNYEDVGFETEETKLNDDDIFNCE